MPIDCIWDQIPERFELSVKWECRWGIGKQSNYAKKFLSYTHFHTVLATNSDNQPYPAAKSKWFLHIQNGRIEFSVAQSLDPKFEQRIIRHGHIFKIISVEKISTTMNQYTVAWISSKIDYFLLQNTYRYHENSSMHLRYYVYLLYPFEFIVTLLFSKHIWFLWMPSISSSFLRAFLLFISVYISSIIGFHRRTRAFINQFDTWLQRQFWGSKRNTSQILWKSAGEMSA